MVSFPEKPKPMPHRPQTLAELQARFPAALKDNHMILHGSMVTTNLPHRKPESPAPSPAASALVGADIAAPAAEGRSMSVLPPVV